MVSMKVKYDFCQNDDDDDENLVIIVNKTKTVTKICSFK